MLASTALSHLTVIDLTRVRAGPTAVRQLADWGAQVLKIEMPAALDESEGIGGPREDSDFQNVHRNKRGMTLNLKAEEGVAILKKLVARADVVVENFRPDVKDKLGIGYETLAAINPRLIYASISGYGEDGPYRLRPGFDQIAQGMGGLMSITGLPGQGPVRVGIPIADLCAGIFCAWGIAVAVIEREHSGQGQWVKSSLLQAQLFMLDFQAARWLMKGEIAKQAGNNHPTSIPTGVYKTRDGYMNLAASGHRIWLRLCDAIGAPELATDPDYATGSARSDNRDQLHAELERHFQQRDTVEWVETLNQAGVPSGPIYAIDQAFADPQVRHLGIAEPLGDTTYLGQPVTLSRTPSRVVSHPPELGEHTDEVLQGLGYDAAGIERLKIDGIIEEPGMASEKMISRKDGGVGWMIFNNPERHNAISLEMWEAALEIMADFSADPSVRVMVVTGAGGKAFASGADISKFKDERQEAEAVAHYQATTQKAYSAIQGMAIPTIAMVRGYCIGGGTAAAVCCDIRVCTENAKFGVPAAKLGLGYGLNRAQPLVDLIGPAYAKEMFFTGRQFDAREAEKMGLVNRVVADDRLEATIEEMTRAIAENAPLTVRCSKLVVGEALKDSQTRDVAATERAVEACFASGDYKEGQAAFMEKRKPRFTGT